MLPIVPEVRGAAKLHLLGLLCAAFMCLSEPCEGLTKVHIDTSAWNGRGALIDVVLTSADGRSNTAWVSEIDTDANEVAVDSIGGARNRNNVYELSDAVFRSGIQLHLIGLGDKVDCVISSTNGVPGGELRDGIALYIRDGSGSFLFAPSDSTFSGAFMVFEMTGTGEGLLVVNSPAVAVNADSVMLAVPDVFQPSKVTNLDAELVGSTFVALTWTAPGDDSTAGQASAYDLRYSTASIDDTNFYLAPSATGSVPSPSASGETEYYEQATGLAANTWYWFALKSVDEAGNWSVISNVLKIKTTGTGGCCMSSREVLGEGASRVEAWEGGAVQGGEGGGQEGELVVEKALDGVESIWRMFRMRESTVGMAAIELQEKANDEWLAVSGSGADKSGPWRVRLPRTRAVRALFPKGSEVGLVAPGLLADAGGGLTALLVAAYHSTLGDVTDRIGQGSLDGVAVGLTDTLLVRYRPAALGEVAGLDGAVVVVGPSRIGGQVGSVPGDMVGVPEAFALAQNRPNPFASRTTIHFDLPQPAQVRLEIFDAQGRRVAALANGWYPAGFHSVDWDRRGEGGARMQPGIYVYRIQAGPFRDRKKLVLLP
jgi:FlgD Ig-like domain